MHSFFIPDSYTLEVEWKARVELKCQSIMKILARYEYIELGNFLWCAMDFSTF